MNIQSRHGATAPLPWPRPMAEEQIVERLFVADTHFLIHDAIRSLFVTSDPSVEVAGFSDFFALEAALKAEPIPNLVLINFTMPGLASVEAVGDFLGRHPGHRIAVISGHVDTRLMRDILRLGCAGFVPKSLETPAVYHAIRLMISGGCYLPVCMVEPPQEPAPVDWRSNIPVMLPKRRNSGLTPREIEVLRSLATGQTNKQIGRALDIEETTVKLHLRRGYAKLGVRNRIEAACAVLEGALD